MPPFATGLQELLCEGSFLDVRISCSDHSPSDGLGSHKLVLAGASSSLLGTCLDTGEEEDMICILLPDYPSSLVASVLSILYYGEVWLSQLSTQIDTVNSLFTSLGLDMVVVSTGNDVKLVRKSLYTTDTHRTANNRIKKEPQLETVIDQQVSTVNIKKEDNKDGIHRANFIPSIHTATVQPLSLLKCPNYSCEFHAETIPDMQTHIYECKQSQSNITESTHHVDVEQGSLNIKREQTVGVKQESVDPLERKIDNEVPINVEASIKITSELKIQNLKFEAASDDEEVDDPGPVEVSDGSRVQCVKCPFTSSSISALHAHVSMHQRKDLLKQIKNICPVCGLQSSNLAELKQHIFTTYARQVSTESYSCILKNCQKVIESSSCSLPQLFYHHILYDHYGSKYKLKCNFCNFEAITTSKLKDHMMQHADERPFTCDICSNGFRTKRHLKEHRTTVHSRDKPVQCPDCPTTFASQQLYRRHSKLKHTDLSYSCNVCKKSLDSPNALRCHMKNVHSAKSVDTPICDKCGGDPSMCRCSGDPHERTVYCPECGKEMFAKNLAGHLHYHRQSSLRPYICQECSKTFTHAASLKRHALLHTGEMKFGCEECGKQFYQKTALETHLKSHSTERLSCEGCNQKFITRYLLNFHLKSRKKCLAVYNI